jgi:biopolymer transport protein ExbD
MAHRKYKKFSVAPANRPNSEINVTPLVDVVLVLLIIFMVVTPLLEKDIEVRVPSTEQVEEMSEVPPDQLVVGITAEGQLTINTEQIADTDYIERLKRVLAAKAAGDKLVFFMADDKTNYGKLITALDGAKQAGAETLGMMTEIPEAAPAPPGEPPGDVPTVPGAETPPTPPTPPAPPAPP